MGDPKNELANKAARLREQRLAATRDEATEREHAEIALEHAVRQGSSGRLRSSLTRVLVLGLAAALICFAPLVAIDWITPEDGKRAELPIALAVGVITMEVGGLFLIGFYFTGVGRSRRWRAKLPFRIDQFEETLGLAEAVTEAAVIVTFRNASVPMDVLVELLTAHVPSTQAIALSGQALEIRSPDFAREGANWPLARWFRKLVRHVLLDVSVAYPIEAVVLRALETREFYIPSGD